MEFLSKFKDLFKRPESEIIEITMSQEKLILKRDKQVASLLGITYPGIVYIIRRACEIIEWKQLGVIQKEEQLVESERESLKKKMELPEFKSAISKKIALTIQEKGHLDYGTEELERQISNIIEMSIEVKKSRIYQSKKGKESNLSQEP